MFFSDLLQCLQFGAQAVDMYLRILKAIDEEVVDRDVARSQQVCFHPENKTVPRAQIS